MIRRIQQLVEVEMTDTSVYVVTEKDMKSRGFAEYANRRNIAEEAAWNC